MGNQIKKLLGCNTQFYSTNKEICPTAPCNCDTPTSSSSSTPRTSSSSTIITTSSTSSVSPNTACPACENCKNKAFSSSSSASSNSGYPVAGNFTENVYNICLNKTSMAVHRFVGDGGNGSEIGETSNFYSVDNSLIDNTPAMRNDNQLSAKTIKNRENCTVITIPPHEPLVWTTAILNNDSLQKSTLSSNQNLLKPNSPYSGNSNVLIGTTTRMQFTPFPIINYGLISHSVGVRDGFLFGRVDGTIVGLSKDSNIFCSKTDLSNVCK